MAFFEELKRRSVFRVAAAYVFLAWLIMQVGDTLAPALHLPEWINSALAFFLVLGFPLAVFLAWAYEITPGGIKKESDVDRSKARANVTGRRLDYLIIALLAAGLLYFVADKFVLEPPREDAEPERSADETGLQATGELTNGPAFDQSIAVLPFADLSPQGDQQYFSDGLAEELLNLLGRVPNLRVISRSSAFSFKGKDIDMRRIATELNVAHVLEGSVRKAGNQLRITVKLFDARSDKQLWSESYDRTFDDIFAVQDEIAKEVVDALEISLLSVEVPKATRTSSEAYALYLRAVDLADRQSEKSLDEAESLLKDALAIDPRHAPSWSRLGTVYMAQSDLGWHPVERRELARHAFRQALTADPGYAPAYTNMGFAARADGDYPAAETYFEKALELNPGTALTVGARASLLRTFGRFDEAAGYARQAIALDPVRSSAYENLGYARYYAGDLEEAEKSFRKALTLKPTSPLIPFYLGRVLLAKGDVQGALAMMQEISASNYRIAGLALAYDAAGHRRESDEALAALIDGWSDEMAFQVAEIHAFRGEHDAAFEWLRKAYENKDAGLVVMLGNPMFTQMTTDPRYEVFVEELGLLPYWKEMN